MKNLIILLCLSGSVASAVEGLQHQNLRWAIKNSGQTISIDLNPLQSYRMQAVAGQDIGVSGLPAKTNAKKIKVAILDTGIDYSHPEISSLIYQNAPKCAAFNTYRSCIKTKGDENAADCRTEFLTAAENVYPADCLGWSILDNGTAPTPNNIIGTPDFYDGVGHGTHVAGIIASVTRDIEIIPVQVIGEGPNQPLKPYSVDLSPSEKVRNGYSNAANLSERVARGMIYAMNSGAQVINLSLGWLAAQDSDVMKDAIAEAQRRGIIIVAAAGNDSTSSLLRPCQYKGVICVGAHRPDGALASFSNYGPGIDIAAPGTEILSTIPTSIRSKRMPGYNGYDYLSGTSQATPFVTGAVAELLSRGISPKDIYPRLILGARAMGVETDVIEGPINTPGKTVNSKSAYKKTLISGLLDIKSALAVTEQTLILPADREEHTIIWDRKSLDLNFAFKLKNFWKASKDQIKIEIKPTQTDVIYPIVASLENSDIKSGWASQEEKSFKVNLKIRDQRQAYLSRLPSELSYIVTVKVNGKVHRQFEVRAEVLVSVLKTMSDPEIQKIPTAGRPQNMSFSLVDEVYDNRQSDRDYLVIGPGQKNNTFNVAINKYVRGTYQMSPVLSIAYDGKFDSSVLQQKIRMDIDSDGRAEYIVRFMEYPDQQTRAFRRGEYIDHFFIFDDAMNLKSSFKYNDYHVLIPPKPQWMKVAGQLRPVWIGNGQEVRKVWNPLDLLGQTEPGQIVSTPMDLHVYYLDKDFKLNQVPALSSGRIVDLIQADVQSVQQGLISVLIAQNLGTEVKPSYSNNFYLGQLSNGQVAIDRNFNGFNINRNLIDTHKDNTLNLNSSNSESRGTMWYGVEAHQTQRVTMFDPVQKTVIDKKMSSQRAIFDSALSIHSGFQSVKRSGVFLMTNSELEYHDLLSDQVATRSLDRYSFIGSDVFVQLQFPVTIVDSLSPSDKLPAVIKTEGAGLTKGHKFLVPVMSSNGLAKEIVAPAKLRLSAEKGCAALDAPVFLGQGSGYAMDYYCGDQILRILLNY